MLPFCKHQTLVVCSCLSIEASLLIPLGTLYFVLFVCFVFLHLKWFSKAKVYMTTCPISKVNSFPFIFQCSLLPLSVISWHLKRKENTLMSVLLLFCWLPAVSLFYDFMSFSPSFPPHSAVLKVITLPHTSSSVTVCVTGLDASQSVKISATLSSRFLLHLDVLFWQWLHVMSKNLTFYCTVDVARQ